MENSFVAFYHEMTVCCEVVGVWWKWALRRNVGKMLLPLQQKEEAMEAQYALRIPHELLDQLRKIAKAQDLTIAQLFRKLARECVEGANKNG